MQTKFFKYDALPIENSIFYIKELQFHQGFNQTRRVAAGVNRRCVEASLVMHDDKRSLSCIIHLSVT